MSKLALVALVIILSSAVFAADLAEPTNLTLHNPAPVRMARLGDGMAGDLPKLDVFAAEAAALTLADPVTEDRSGAHTTGNLAATVFFFGDKDIRDKLIATADLELEYHGLRVGIALFVYDGEVGAGPVIKTDMAAAADLIAMATGRPHANLPPEVRWFLSHVGFGFGGDATRNKWGGFYTIEAAEWIFSGP